MRPRLKKTIHYMNVLTSNLLLFFLIIAICKGFGSLCYLLSTQEKRARILKPKCTRCITHSTQLGKNRYTCTASPFNSAPLNRESTNFTKVWKPHPITRGRKGDTQQVPYIRHKNIRFQSKNIIRPVDLVPEI